MLFRTLIPAAALMLAACSGQAADKPADAASGQSVIEVKEAFVVKPAEGRDIAAGGLMAYVTGAPVELVGASTDAAARVELHTMSMEDGVMQMRQVESFTASEGEPIVLQRGGNHLMLFGFDPSVAVGDKVDLALEFRDSDGTSQTVVTSAEVKGLGD
ncbi:MAG: copper chaperone PCu(A)C [Rhodobacterales bacterium]|nr:copper chaperone PCu(A)C [Rhodobacterales bacterium]